MTIANHQSILVAALAAGAVLSSANRASAIDCSTLPSPLYVTGSTASKPLLAVIGTALTSSNPPSTIVYLGQGSCTGVDAILNHTPVMGVGAAGLNYWDATGTQQECDVAAPGLQADVGISDVFAPTCFSLPNGLPASVGNFFGPVQTMTFVVPKASTELAISARAGYFVYGFGATSGVDPWTNPSFIFQRDDQSGTQRMIAAAIGVDASLWRGTGTTGSGDILMKVSASASPANTIGILAAVYPDTNPTMVKELAYKHFDQDCGYFPDAQPTTHEKRNVRDGHYAIWGPIHLFAPVDGNGVPTNLAAGNLIGYLSGTKPPPAGLDIFSVFAQQSVIPQCAMRVSRTDEVGALASFAPLNACGCHYDELTNGTTDCTPCMTASDCPNDAPVCSYNYCETQ